MKTQNQILEIPGLFTNKISKRLIFEVAGLTIEKPFSFDSAIYIPADKLSAIRLGKKSPGGMGFFLGKHFIIDLKHPDDSFTQIKFSCYCGLRMQAYEEAWTDAINHLYSFYFSSQLNMYIELFHLKQSFEILGVTFHDDGISWGNNAIVPWKHVTLSNYTSNFVIHHRNSPRLNIGFNFSYHWNAYLLQGLLKYVVEEHYKMLSK